MSPMRIAVLLTLAGAALIPLGDAVAKFANATYGIPMGFMAWSRFALGALLFAPLALARGVRPRDMAPLPVLLRGLLIVITVALILQAAARAPIADVFGAFFIAPVVSFLLAIAVLKEKAGLARWALILLGFLSVLLIVRPGAGISHGMMFALAAGLFYGIFLTANRGLSRRFSATAMLWAQLCVGGVVLLPLAIGPVGEVGAPGAILCIVASAVTSATANYLIVLAYARAEAVRLAPLIYAQLIAATVYGLLFFGAWPDALTLAGLTLLVVSGAAGLVFRLR